jgi:hypothetical protein
VDVKQTYKEKKRRKEKKTGLDFTMMNSMIIYMVKKEF